MQTSEKLVDNKEGLCLAEAQIKEEVNSSPREPEISDDKISKYFAENYETFNYLYKIFEFSLYVSAVCLLSLLLTFLLNSIFIFTHFISWAFAFMSTLFCIIFVNLYLKMKGMLDSAKTNSTSNFGSIMTYACFNLVAGNAIICLTLIAIKIGKSDDMLISTVFIPIYVAIAIELVYLTFILPALTSFKLWLDITLYVVLIVGQLTFLIMLSDKLDYSKESVYTWTQISAPSYVIVGYYLLYLVLSYLKENEAQKSLSKLILNLLGYLQVLFALALFFLKKSGAIFSEDYVPALLLFLGGFTILYDKVFKCAIDSD